MTNFTGKKSAGEASLSLNYALGDQPTITRRHKVKYCCTEHSCYEAEGSGISLVSIADKILLMKNKSTAASDNYLVKVRTTLIPSIA